MPPEMHLKNLRTFKKQAGYFKGSKVSMLQKQHYLMLKGNKKKDPDNCEKSSFTFEKGFAPI